MHGIQLCSASIRVLWAKLFPEDTHEGGDDENADEGPVGSTEAFPVQIALGNSEKYATLKQSRKTLTSAGEKGGLGATGTGAFVMTGNNNTLTGGQPLDDDQSQLTIGSANRGDAGAGGVDKGGGAKRVAGFGGVLAGDDMVATHALGGASSGAHKGKQLADIGHTSHHSHMSNPTQLKP